MSNKSEFAKAKERMDAIQVATNVRYYVRSLMRPSQAAMILEVLSDEHDSDRLALDEAFVHERMGRELGEQFIDNALEHRDSLIAIARVVLGGGEEPRT